MGTKRYDHILDIRLTNEKLQNEKRRNEIFMFVRRIHYIYTRIFLCFLHQSSTI